MAAVPVFIMDNGPFPMLWRSKKNPLLSANYLIESLAMFKLRFQIAPYKLGKGFKILEYTCYVTNMILFCSNQELCYAVFD